jgi:hypothetical protein
MYSESGIDTSSTIDGSFPWLFFVILVVLITAIIGVYLYINIRRRRLHRKAQIDKRILRVTMAKPRKEDQERKDPKELIAVMEPIIASLSHFTLDDFWARFWQGNPIFSLEIVSQKGEIYFQIVVPAAFQIQIEQLIHSQYPDAHIERADENDIFLEHYPHTDLRTLCLLKQFIFPIRTYRNLEGDPLSGLTNALSKVGQGQAAMQILIQPTDQTWQNKVHEALHNIQQGKHFTNNGSPITHNISKIAKEVKLASFSEPNPEEQDQFNEAQNTSRSNVRLTAAQEQIAKAISEKGSKVGFKVQIRCLSRDEGSVQVNAQLASMVSAFAQYQSPELNGFRVAQETARNLMLDFLLRAMTPSQPTMILNTEEIASLFHFPNLAIDTPNIHWLGSRRLPPPTILPKTGLLIGYSEYRGNNQPIFMQPHDRARHFYMIGMTGVGKTTLFQNMVLQDIRNGEGVCYMDPNGDAVEWILQHIPKERAEDVILFDPSDTARPLALNLLEFDERYPEQKTMVINEMISIFDKLYDLKATGGPIFEQYMRNAMLLIMDDPESGSTLMEISKVLADPDFRKYKLSKCKSQIVIDFWVKEAEKAGGDAALANIVPYITSKLTQFTTNDIMRPIIGQQKSAFNFRQIMDQRRILLVSLPKGLLGEMNAMLLGMIISGKIQISAFSRQNQPEQDRIPFYMYVDEFQNFTSKTFATILSEARKYKLALNVTNQYLEQLDDDTKGAIFGNVGTLLSWRIGPDDAEYLTKQFDPLTRDDLVNTEKFNFYIKLLVDGTPSRPFNATAYPPDPHANKEVGEAVRQLSRLKHGRDRDLVEAEIRLRSRNMV